MITRKLYRGVNIKPLYVSTLYYTIGIPTDYTGGDVISEYALLDVNGIYIESADGYYIEVNP